MNCVFPNLLDEIKNNNYTVADLSEKTNIGYASMRNKLTGRTEPTVTECMKIRKLFPDCTLEYLFARAQA